MGIEQALQTVQEKLPVVLTDELGTALGADAGAGNQIQAISLKPKEGQARFKTLCVNQSGAVEGYDCWPRNVDTEFKILEDLAGRLKDPAVAGNVRLYTELYPCPSCWNVMKQFLAAYPNVQMEVLYRKN